MKVLAPFNPRESQKGTPGTRAYLCNDVQMNSMVGNGLQGRGEPWQDSWQHSIAVSALEGRLATMMKVPNEGNSPDEHDASEKQSGYWLKVAAGCHLRLHSSAPDNTDANVQERWKRIVLPAQCSGAAAVKVKATLAGAVQGNCQDEVAAPGELRRPESKTRGHGASGAAVYIRSDKETEQMYRKPGDTQPRDDEQCDGQQDPDKSYKGTEEANICASDKSRTLITMVCKTQKKLMGIGRTDAATAAEPRHRSVEQARAWTSDDNAIMEEHATHAAVGKTKAARREPGGAGTRAQTKRQQHRRRRGGGHNREVHMFDRKTQCATEKQGEQAREEEEEEEANLVCFPSLLSRTTGTEMLLSSGTTVSIVNNAAYLKDAKPCKTRIKVANGERMSATSEGVLWVETMTQAGDWCTLQVQRALLVEECHATYCDWATSTALGAWGQGTRECWRLPVHWLS